MIALAVALGVVVADVDGMKIGREHPYDWHDLLVAIRAAKRYAYTRSRLSRN